MTDLEVKSASNHPLAYRMKSYFGQKDLLHSKTSALSSRTTASSQLSSRSSSDKYLGYSLITNDSCVSTHRARVLVVATVTCITAVSLVVVIIVMTLTNEVTDSTSDRTSPCKSPDGCSQDTSCHDYIIVGGGLAGAYAAWKLRHTNKTVHLHEGSGRIGGNLHTETFSFLPEVKLETGLPYFTHKLHHRTEELVRTLELGVRQYYGPYPQENIGYFTRGDLSSHRNLSKNLLKRYRLSVKETGHLQDLVKQGAEKAIHSAPATYLLTKSLQDSMALVSGANGENVYDSKQSVRMTLLNDASNEGYNCIRDTSRQMDFMEEANARQLTELLNFMEEHQIDAHQDTLTLEEGMQRLPEVLIEETRKHNHNFRVHLNYKLASITKDTNSLSLKFHRYVPVGPLKTPLAQEELTICSDHVILDLTPSQLRQVQLPFSLPDDFDAIQPTKGLVMYLMFNGTLYPDIVTNGSYWISTDTPLGDIAIFHAVRNVTIWPDNATITTTPYPDYNITTESPDTNVTAENPLLANQTSSPSSSVVKLSSSTTTDKVAVTARQNGTTSNTATNPSPSNMTTTLPTMTETAAPLRHELHPVTVIQAVFTLQESYYHYWQALLKQGLPVSDASRSISDTAFRRLKTHLEQVLHQSINETAAPLLSGVVYNLTDQSDSGPLSYTWKPGYDWSSKPTQLMHPDSVGGSNVYLVGQAYAPSYDSLGTEGHLSTVDSLLEYLRHRENSTDGV